MPQRIVSQTLDETGEKTAYSEDRPNLEAWLQESNAHGLCYHSPIWLPEGEKPEQGEYIRAPWLDQLAPRSRWTGFK